MPDIFFSLVFLSIASMLGVPFTRLLPERDFRWRMLTAPVFGLGALAIIVAAAYRHDLPLRGTAVVASIAAGAIAVWLLAAFLRRPAGRRSLSTSAVLTFVTVAAILLLSLAPKWVGGPRYAIFQGNQYDQLIYMAHVASARARAYSERRTSTFDQPILNGGQAIIHARPTPQLLVAALSLLLGADTIQASYPYLVSLQVITFFGVAFLMLQVFPVRFGVVLLCGAAATIGFPMQYAFDTNAWGKLAGMPSALITIALFLTVLVRSADKPSPSRREIARLSLALASVVAALFYLYPEMLPVYGAVVIGAIAAWAVINRGRLEWRWLTPCALGLALGTASCLLFIEGTFLFFVRELWFATNVHVGWWEYFQAYLIYDGPLSFVVSALGLYFLLPPDALTGAPALVWRGAAYMLTAGILVLAAAAWRHIGVRNQRAFLLLVGTIASTAIIAITAISGRYWAAGEAWIMLGPLVFVALVSPLVLAESRPTRFRLAGAAVIACHLVLGMARPIAAADESGVHYPAPYPAAQGVSEKARYDWDIHQYDKSLSSCESIGLDLENRFLEYVVGFYLTDRNRQWESTHPDRQALGATDASRTVPLGDDIDCVITTGLALSTPDRTVFSLAADRRLEQFLAGETRAVEIAVPSPAGVQTLGAHGVGPYGSHRLRWTSGETRFVVPVNPASPVSELELILWPVRVEPTRIMRVTVNGKQLFEGALPFQQNGSRWSVADQTGDTLDVRIFVAPAKAPNDPRDLGVPLRSLTLKR